jgi:hypothetical protein
MSDVQRMKLFINDSFLRNRKTTSNDHFLTIEKRDVHW